MLMRRPASKLFSACLPACLVFAMAAAASSQQSGQPAGESKPSPTAQAVPEKPAEKHSTPEDRQRVVAIAHKLEAAPLDSTLVPEREWALKWVIAAPDVHVRVCTNLLADLRRPKYKYRSELLVQQLLSSAAFVIEHPEQASDDEAQSVGGMEGVLKAYSAILKAEPQATAPSLDAFLQQQKEGKLADAVREKTKDCQ